MIFARQKQCFVFFLVVAFAWLPTKAFGHHPPRISNVATTTPNTLQNEDMTFLQLGIRSAFLHFEYRGRDLKKNDETTLSIFRITPSFQLLLKTGSDLRIEVPAGHIFEAELTGLADPTLSIGQRFSINGFRFYGSLALSIPLGLGVSKTLFSANDLALGETIDVVTYNIQAALSAQTPMLMGAFVGRVPLRIKNASLGARLEAGTPVKATPQGLVFGEDILGALGANYSYRKIYIGVGVFGEHHFADQDPSGRKFGQRSSLGLSTQGTWRFSKTFSCHASVQFPIWQNAHGAQMLRTFVSAGSCTLGFDS